MLEHARQDQRQAVIDSYLNAAIRQAEERARILKGKISKTVQAPELVALHQTCQDRIDQTIEQLRALLTDPLILRRDLVQERIRLFRRILADLSLLETTGIAALTRPHQDDITLSKLVFQIHKEIGYPLSPPTVTCLSRDYFSINTALRLLEVPLAESDFLLHLPDLYHELAHPLIATRNNPQITPYQTEYGRFLTMVTRHFEGERATNLRSTGPKHYFAQALDLLEYFWIRGWANELFSDLFAIYTLGEAYAWAHFHLTAGRDIDPYDVQIPGFMSHPPDQARMETMLIGLELVGLKKEGAEVQQKWESLIGATGVRPTSLYRRACPRELLERAAIHALQGTKLIGCRIVHTGTSSPVHDLLNRAWGNFWAAPDNYHAWEREAIAKLKQSASDAGA
jgi:hypothetical protein